MAGIGGFLQGLGLAYGNSLIAGQDFQEKQARTDLMKSQAMMQGIQAQKMQQQVRTEKQLGDFINSEMAVEGADATLPQNQAKMFTKAAGLAASMGDFQSMTEMSGLAKEATAEARNQATYLAQQQARSREDLAQSATQYADNPTPDGANDLARKAIAAGQNPASIPLPNSPKWGTWVNQQRLAGMDSKDRANFVQKAADMKANRDQKWQEHEDNIGLRQAQMAQTAAFREANLEMHRESMASREDKAPKTIDVAGSTYEFDPQGGVKGERLASDGRYVKLGQKITATQENNITAIGGAAAEASRNLQQMARFPTGSAQSPFSHITDHDFVAAIGKTAATALTPEQVQMFDTSSAGLATELSRVMTLGGGRGANQSVINEVRKQITPVQGDTNLTAAYKLSTGAQIVLTRMEATPRPSDATVAAKWDKTIEELQKFPSPEAVLSAAQGKQAGQLRALQGKYSDLLQQVQDTGTGVPGTADTGKGGNAPPLPAGWTVTEH